MKIKKNMSSPDIKLIIDEISEEIRDNTIDNIYELNEIYVFRLKGFKPGTKRQVSLLIQIGKRIHLTEFKREFPERPSPKCLTFRKFLKNGKITKLSQLGSDRIALLEVENLETKKNYTLIFELFGKGNIILIENINDENEQKTKNKVIFALWYRIMKDRALLAGKEFTFPPTRGISLLEATIQDINQIPTDEDGQIVKILVKNFGISGEIVEEILELIDIDKKTNIKQVIPGYSQKIATGIKTFKDKIIEGPAVILGDEDNIPFTVLPYPFSSIKGNPIRNYQNFNQACDQYFSSNELALESREELVYSNKIKQLNKRLEKQLSHVDSLIETVEEKKKLGLLISNYAYLIEELLNSILKANKSGKSWEEIEQKLLVGKEKKIPSAVIFEKFHPKIKEITINLDNTVINFDFTRKPFEIANKYYQQSKKAESKIEPASQLIESIKKDIEELKEQKDQATAVKKAKAVKKRSKRWFEQYHWTVTSSGKLIIAGRNARMNEQLVKKRLEDSNMFLHADVQGAPYTIIKNEKIDILTANDSESNNEEVQQGFSDLDLNEAAFIAGCYSKAWKSGLGLIEVYAVNPSQLSFSAPSGEYLPKGGIIVSGKRTYFKIPMQLYIGVNFDDTHAFLFVSGNETTIKKHTVVYTILNNSNSSQKKSEIAKKIQAYFEKMIKDSDDQVKLKTLTINDFILKIP
ncbi:MAG: ribosome rescue protein RqcH [Candidatus Hodarchaeales archaeon]|jgi:predicted ribosome quality control (RQC) complex YloA/Tae2 family protein